MDIQAVKANFSEEEAKEAGKDGYFLIALRYTRLSRFSRRTKNQSMYR